MTGARLQRATGVVEHELDGQLLLLRPGGVDVLHLDAVASDVWRCLSATPTPEELVEALAVAYAVDAARVSVDLQPVLALLRQHGLLERAHG